MFIKVEPAEFFMYRVIMVFDLESPDSEDPAARDYMNEWELEPKYQRVGDFEGHNSEFMQFGGCYLGKHLGKIAEIQRRHVEAELLTAEIDRLLQGPGTFGGDPRRPAGRSCPGAGGSLPPGLVLPDCRKRRVGGCIGRGGGERGRPRPAVGLRQQVLTATPSLCAQRSNGVFVPETAEVGWEGGAGDGNRTHMASLEG